MSKLSDIEGISDADILKLEEAGINTLEKLLQTASEKKGREDLAEKTGISEAFVLEWVKRADLARIKGINTQYADLLEFCGVDTVPELAQRRADHLHAKIVEVNDAKNLVKRVPALSHVDDWIAHAKELPRIINY